MNFKIVSDCSSNVLQLSQVPFASAPLTIVAGSHTFVDDAELDVAAMTAELKNHKGKSSTACPGPQDWLTAFGDAEAVICVTITSGISGAYNAAKIAAHDYEELHPGRRVFVLDTLSTGPEMQLIVEKAEELILSGMDFDAIAEALTGYARQTHLIFSLCSLHNFVMNGRVNPALGAIVGLLNIRVIGCASAKGELEPIAKTRGDKKALQALLTAMRERGFNGGKVRLAHSNNELLAQTMRDLILTEWPGADISMEANRGLCSYYCEEGGLLVGFEG